MKKTITILVMAFMMALTSFGEIPTGNVDLSNKFKSEFTIIAKQINGIPRTPEFYVYLHHSYTNGKHYIYVKFPEITSNLITYKEDESMIEEGYKCNMEISGNSNQQVVILSYLMCQTDNEEEFGNFSFWTFKNNLQSVSLTLYGSKFKFEDLEFVNK